LWNEGGNKGEQALIYFIRDQEENMSYLDVNAKAVANTLRYNLYVYQGSVNMVMETPSPPVAFMYAGKGVLLGPLNAHAPADARKVQSTGFIQGTFTIELRKTGTVGRDRKFLVTIYASQSSVELKDEIERCIHQAMPGNWEVRFN
jgi:hypothetical protein